MTRPLDEPFRFDRYHKPLGYLISGIGVNALSHGHNAMRLFRVNVFLRFPLDSSDFAFVLTFQGRVIQFPRFRLTLALQSLKLTLHLIRCAGFHSVFLLPNCFELIHFKAASGARL